MNKHFVESMDPEKGTTIERLFEEEEVDHIPTAVSSTFLKRKAAAEGGLIHYHCIIH